MNPLLNQPAQNLLPLPARRALARTLIWFALPAFALGRDIILDQPTNITVEVGQTATFTVVAKQMLVGAGWGASYRNLVYLGACSVFAGAAGPPFVGANVENGSYGLTICAERTAICAGVVAGHRRLTRIAVTCTDASGSLVRGIVPCGACLQVICEFGGPDTEIVIDGGGTFRLADFLPRPFGADVTVPRATA